MVKLRSILLHVATSILVGLSAAPASEITAAQRDFFESSIRSVLVNECYECHSTQGKQRANLVLDHRAGWQKGSENGPVIVPGKPEASRLIAAIQHKKEDLKMPKAGVKLSPQVVADFKKWIDMGAPDPRDKPPSPAEVAATADWRNVMEQRKKWWSLQPVANVEIPDNGAENAVDQFLIKNQKEAELTPALMTDSRTLLRRLSMILTGLPPSPEAIDAFEANTSESAYETQVDAMLESSAFGERWARHWMDWFRYAESHGSEGDPAIPFAWRYRDYLIRSLNADVPYDQLVREHIAGDLLENPRVLEGNNESALGTAQFRMVQHGFAPTDALDELVRFTDNQIDVVSKGFLGLTVSCARCHNHKFDAISQADFYALFGILTSCRPATRSLNILEPADGPRTVILRMKALIKQRLVAAWMTQAVAENLLEPNAPWQSAIENAVEPDNPLYAWNQMRELRDGDFEEAWKKLRDAWKDSVKDLERQRRHPYEHRWQLGKAEDAAQWFAHGTGTTSSPTPRGISGEFHLPAEGERVVDGIFPAALLSHSLTTRDSAVFQSPGALMDGQFRVYVRAAGTNRSLARYVVRHYPRDGTVYPVARLDEGNWKWLSWDLNYWSGDSVHIEVATAADSPVLGRADAERSWAAVSEVIFAREGEPTPADHFAEFVSPLFLAAGDDLPANQRALANLYATAISTALKHWQEESLSDSEARFLNFLSSIDLLPSTLDALPAVAPLIAEFRELESRLPAPARAPGIVEAEPVVQPLLERGDHKQPGTPVPRRFLDAFGARLYPEGISGRRELAEDIISGNPLAARVIVNRLWHHIFGRGIVATTDNFGRLGSLPSHPELLDHLARRMQEGGWSIKKMLKLLVMSEAFQRSASPPSRASDIDPDNVLLSHWKVRRLSAEAIRDSVLAVSGQLDPEMFGPATSGDSSRRSVYVRVIRNDLDPFLSVFDAPVPNSTQGSRNASNVPAQSLTMMNAPFVTHAAKTWIENYQRKRESDVEQQVETMFLTALGRSPTKAEAMAATRFLRETRIRMETLNERRATLSSEQMRIESELNSLLNPVRQQLLSARKVDATRKNGTEKDALDLKPVGEWDFSNGTNDLRGSLHIKLKEGAQLESGALHLNGDGAHAVTPPLTSPLREKTLQVLVQLTTTDQTGGGAMTVETLDGDIFDAIVFGERKPLQWMAGSNGFSRTDDFDGASEEVDATSEPVWITVVYHSDGTISGFRNGLAYGKSYRSTGVVSFEKNEARILFGCRHSPASADRCLEGKIFRARMFNRALTPEEVQASSSQSPIVTEQELIASLTDAQNSLKKKLETTLAETKAQIERLNREDASDPSRPWVDLAHSIFNLKEFIYLK